MGAVSSLHDRKTTTRELTRAWRSSTIEPGRRFLGKGDLAPRVGFIAVPCAPTSRTSTDSVDGVAAPSRSSCVSPRSHPPRPLLVRDGTDSILTSNDVSIIFGIMKSKAAIEALSALAQETRLRHLSPARAPGARRPAGRRHRRAARHPAPTLSFHLAQLSRAGLVASRREGRSILYAADYRGMNGLLTYLTEDCCQGRPELCVGAACSPPPPSQFPIRRRPP